MILVINTGSSSIKTKLFKRHKGVLIEVSAFSSAGISSKNISNFSRATTSLFRENNLDKKDIKKVAYRIVHGGDEGKNKSTIDVNVEKLIEKYNHLSPNHNPYALAVIRQTKKLLKDAKHYAFFDTAYFSSIPDENKLFPLPKLINHGIEIKKYGFHGLSHQYIYEKGASGKKAITVHLGAGCSIAAINREGPQNTTMGSTPLGGLVMLSRPGDLDPGVVLEYAQKYGYKKSLDVLAKKSGLLSITNKTSSMLDIIYQAFGYIEDDKSMLSRGLPTDVASTKKAEIAISKFVRSIQKHICEYYIELGGCDHLIFSGRIGTGSKKIRSLITKDIKFLDIKNIEAITTDEEKMMASYL